MGAPDQMIELAENAGVTPANESRGDRDLGTQYQLVTDHTSMLVLPTTRFSAASFRNQARVAVEEVARAAATAPVKRRVDKRRCAPSRAPGLGGAIVPSPASLLVVGAVGAVGAFAVAAAKAPSRDAIASPRRPRIYWMPGRRNFWSSTARRSPTAKCGVATGHFTRNA